jgi:hypothetical protein
LSKNLKSLIQLVENFQPNLVSPNIEQPFNEEEALTYSPFILVTQPFSDIYTVNIFLDTFYYTVKDFSFQIHRFNIACLSILPNSSLTNISPSDQSYSIPSKPYYPPTRPTKRISHILQLIRPYSPIAASPIHLPSPSSVVVLLHDIRFVLYEWIVCIA